MTEVFARPETWPLWDAVGDDRPDWEAVFEGYASAVDAPAMWFYRELAEAFPDAPLILTVRDPEAWCASVRKTVNSPEARTRFAGSQVGPTIGRLRALSGRNLGLDWLDWKDDAEAIALYHRHIASVREAFPPERLLVYDVAEGWEPLCAFLGRPVPAGPFPRSNDARQFWTSMAPI